MVEGCGNNCVKYSVLVVNGLVCITGAVVLSVSLALALSPKFQDDFASIIQETEVTGDTLASMRNLFYVTAGIGGLIFLTGFLGCCGAACESTCLLGTFFTIILVLFLAQLSVGIAALVLQGKGKLQQDVDKFYKDTVIKTYIPNCSDKENALTISWNNLQTENHCCGYYSSIDYLGSDCAKYCDSKYQIIGCRGVIWNQWQSSLVAIGGVSIGLLIIEFLAMIFGCTLCTMVRKRYRNYETV